LRQLLLLLIIVLPVLTGKAQHSGYKAFTTEDGLPSNHVYQSVEDDHGFLWVATDAGLARFDGKHFQVFTKEHGLPDNEVLQVIKEKNGRIWASCFKQLPVYFDGEHNRFYTPAIGDTLNRRIATLSGSIFALPDSGMAYHDERGSFIFMNTKLVRHNFHYIARYLSADALVQMVLERSGAARLVLISRDKKSDSAAIFNVSGATRPGQVRIVSANNKVYVYSSFLKRIFVFSDIDTSPLRYKMQVVAEPEPAFYIHARNDYFFLLSNSGKIHVFDGKTNKLIQSISGNYLPNGYYKDRSGNYWISTIDHGLLFYRHEDFRNLLPRDFPHANFISISKKGNKLLAGNYYGEVAEIDGGNIVTHKIVRKTPSRQRKIIPVGNNIYTFSEDGIVLNYRVQIKYSPAQKMYPAKNAILYNDSTIIVGTPSGVAFLNTRTHQLMRDIRYKRVTSLAKLNEDTVYFGSNDGFHRFYPRKGSFEPLDHLHPFLKDRVDAVHITGDSLVWMANSGSGLGVLKNNRVIARITVQDGLISNNCRSLVAGRKGQLWVGTTQGISIIHYSLKNDSLRYRVQNLSVNDGLSSNEINEMLYDRDSIYATTGNGISVIPADVKITPFHIPVKLIRISIDQQDTVISNHYKLGPGKYSIDMQFAAIELGGHFKNYQYRLNEDSNWTAFTGSNLTIQPGSGSHRLQVRALDVNGSANSDILGIDFYIATQFWKTIWFWVLMVALVQLMVWFLITRWQKNRKEKKIQREMAVLRTASLEQQAFTSLMNPHFIFNALNSVQHYINVQDRKNANRYLSDFASLIRKNFEASQQSFIPLEQELDNITIYLRLEQMRFSDRFDYRIYVDEKVDVEDWMIPTMMLQPLLENAVLHGIMPSAVHGVLLVSITAATNNLVIKITDNGIGIKNSLELKQQTLHNSHGMELIRKRVAALGQLSSEPVSINTYPAFDSVANPGNTTEIILPRSLYESWLTQTRSHKKP
jgi:ligand-binding sensor domain-containing protein/two-component sensor histidine kinase